MLATTMEGDLFVWGCGLTHQLGNRPRDVSNPYDADEEPQDELRPYRVSSKQLEQRFVMVADGGAQHTVELAWDGSYGKPQPAEAAVSVEVEGRSQEAPSDEPPLKRRAVEVAPSMRHKYNCGIFLSVRFAKFATLPPPACTLGQHF